MKYIVLLGDSLVTNIYSTQLLLVTTFTTGLSPCNIYCIQTGSNAYCDTHACTHTICTHARTHAHTHTYKHAYMIKHYTYIILIHGFEFSWWPPLWSLYPLFSQMCELWTPTSCCCGYLQEKTN